MAEDDDKESKSQDPSQKKIDNAIEEGNLPLSRELSTTLLLASSVLIVAFLHPTLWPSFVWGLAEYFHTASTQPMENAKDVREIVGGAIRISLHYTVPISIVLAGAGILSYISQGAMRLHAKKINPDFSRISAIKGWKRLFSEKSIVEFLKAFLKLLGISGVVTWAIMSEADLMLATMMGDISLLVGGLERVLFKILVLVCSTSLLLTIVDIAFSRRTWWRDLKMTHQEVKDEHKQIEGNPLVKGRIRSLLQSSRKRRMMQDLVTATVVITNPTHYAIALRYDRADGGAPIVVAKGVDLIALRIRALSDTYNVPNIENKPLVRSMYPVVDVGDAIPEEFYKAIAEIIVLIQSGGHKGASVKM